MAAPRRRFTEEEKVHIVELAKQSNISKVLRDYKLSYSVFSRWKHQMEKGSVMQSHEDLIALRNENIILKRIVAEQALQLQIQKEKQDK